MPAETPVQLPLHSLAKFALATPDAPAIIDSERSCSYAELSTGVARMAAFLKRKGVGEKDRIAVIATKRIETVVGLLATLQIAAIAVPINPQLKTDQIRHILQDSGSCALLGAGTTAESIRSSVASDCSLLTHWINIDEPLSGSPSYEPTTNAFVSEDSPALILYTSGSTAQPKGVVVSHSNLGFGAMSVTKYLKIRPGDRLLAMMPLSFDYGLNQIISALHVGACAVLFDYLVPKGVVSAVVEYQITGLAAVPHLWNQVARLNWPPVPHLRYVTNTGGRMPVETTRELARKLPQTKIVLMYGFTEAFRSTWLPPEEIANRPRSIGHAVPYAQVSVINSNGLPCKTGEVGELVHSGPLVALGYWNDEPGSRAKFRTTHSVSKENRRTTERCAWSGDLVRYDEDGYLYFESRRDDMVKLHGYRVNPLEIEAAMDRCSLVEEVCVICVPHPRLGQAAIAVTVANIGDLDAITQHCRKCLPGFMIPERILIANSLPASPNNKIDRQALRDNHATLFQISASKPQ